MPAVTQRDAFRAVAAPLRAGAEVRARWETTSLMGPGRSGGPMLGVFGLFLLSGCADDPAGCRPDADAPTPSVLVATPAGVLNFTLELPGLGTDRDVNCFVMPSLTLSDSNRACRLVFMAAPASIEASRLVVDEVFLDASFGCSGLSSDVVGVYTLTSPSDTYFEVPSAPYELNDTFRRVCLDEGPILHFGGGTFTLDGDPIDGVRAELPIFEFEHQFAGPVRQGTGGGRTCP